MPQPTPSSVTPKRRAALPMWTVGDGAPPAGAFVALVSGADAPLIAVGLPASLKGIAREDVARRQALDRLGGTAATLDIRPASGGGGDAWSRVVVAERAQVLRWRTALGPAANRCRALIPDYAALATAPGLWSFEHADGTVRARLGPEDGFTAEPKLAERLIVQALHHASANNALPRAILWIGPRIAALDARLDGFNLVTRAEDLPDLVRPQVMAHGEASLDFARDPRADAEAIETRLRRMIWPAALLVLGALGWAGATAVSISQDQDAALALEGQITTAARRDLLGNAPILDLRVQVMRAIEARRGGAQVGEGGVTGLALLRDVSQSMVATDAQVLSVALGQAFDGVVLDIVVADFRALDTVLAAITSGGLSASVTRSGINPGGGVAATLSVVGGAL